MPVGLPIAPISFQQHIANLFEHLSNVKVFLDDILVAAEITKEQIAVLKPLHKILTKNKLKLKLEKYICYRKYPFSRSEKYNTKIIYLDLSSFNKIKTLDVLKKDNMCNNQIPKSIPTNHDEN